MSNSEFLKLETLMSVRSSVKQALDVFNGKPGTPLDVNDTELKVIQCALEGTILQLDNQIAKLSG